MPNDFTDYSTVLLFDPSLIIRMMNPGMRKNNTRLRTIQAQRIVDKSTIVIGVNPQDYYGHLSLYALETLYDQRLLPRQKWYRLRPAGKNVSND